MKKAILSCLILFAASTSFLMAQTNFYDFTVNNIYGEEVNMSDFKGKKILVVNTASECGLTPQYEVLEEIYREHGGEDFVIIGFPANNFGGQEPGTNEEIASFCKANYGVSFPMMEKISVKGDDMHPLYHWLTKKEKNGVEDAEVSWNFQKFMIDEEGNYIGMVKPQESPASDVILEWINK